MKTKFSTKTPIKLSKSVVKKIRKQHTEIVYVYVDRIQTFDGHWRFTQPASILAW